jgi:chromosome segregation ATPase
MATGPHLSNVDPGDLAGRVSSLEEELRERVQELQERHRDLRALQFQVAVRDAFVVQLQEERNTQRNRLRAEAEAWRAQLEEANEDRQARLEQVQTLDRMLMGVNQDRQAGLEQVQTLERMLREANEDRQARLAQVQTRERMLNELEAQLDQTRLALRALQAYSDSAGFRLVNAVSVRLRSWPRLYRPLRAMVRACCARAIGRLSHDRPATVTRADSGRTT